MCIVYLSNQEHLRMLLKSMESKPKNNLVFEPLQQVEDMPSVQFLINKNPLSVDRKTARSMIHPQYADRFIRQYILDEKIWKQE